MKERHTLQKDKRNGNYYIWLMRDGVSKYFPFGKDRRQAEKELRQLKRDVEAGKIPFVEQETSQVVDGNGLPDIRIEELIVRYLQWLRTDHAESTFETRKIYLNDFYAFIGERMVSGIKPIDLITYHRETRERLLKRREDRRKEHPDSDLFDSDNAGNIHLRHVKTMLKWGVDMGLCSLPFRKFPPITESPARLLTPTSADIEQLIAKLPPDLHDTVALEILTGLRPQELTRLTKDNLREIDGQACLVVTPKSERLMRQPKPRVIPLSSEALEIVTRAISLHPDAQTVFVNDDGKAYTAQTYRQRFQRWCRRAGIRKMPPYALRHYFGSHQAGMGTNSQVLSQLLGHTTTRTTARYVEPVPEYQQKAMETYASKVSARLRLKADTVIDYTI